MDNAGIGAVVKIQCVAVQAIQKCRIVHAHGLRDTDRPDFTATAEAVYQAVNLCMLFFQARQSNTDIIQQSKLHSFQHSGRNGTLLHFVNTG